MAYIEQGDTYVDLETGEKFKKDDLTPKKRKEILTNLESVEGVHKVKGPDTQRELQRQEVNVGGAKRGDVDAFLQSAPVQPASKITPEQIAALRSQRASQADLARAALRKMGGRPMMAQSKTQDTGGFEYIPGGLPKPGGTNDSPQSVIQMVPVEVEGKGKKEKKNEAVQMAPVQVQGAQTAPTPPIQINIGEKPDPVLPDMPQSGYIHPTFPPSPAGTGSRGTAPAPAQVPAQVPAPAPAPAQVPAPAPAQVPSPAPNMSNKAMLAKQAMAKLRGGTGMAGGGISSAIAQTAAPGGVPVPGGIPKPGGVPGGGMPGGVMPVNTSAALGAGGVSGTPPATGGVSGTPPATGGGGVSGTGAQPPSQSGAQGSTGTAGPERVPEQVDDKKEQADASKPPRLPTPGELEQDLGITEISQSGGGTYDYASGAGGIGINPPGLPPTRTELIDQAMGEQVSGLKEDMTLEELRDNIRQEQILKAEKARSFNQSLEQAQSEIDEIDEDVKNYRVSTDYVFNPRPVKKTREVKLGYESEPLSEIKEKKNTIFFTSVKLAEERANLKMVKSEIPKATGAYKEALQSNADKIKDTIKSLQQDMIIKKRDLAAAQDRGAGKGSIAQEAAPKSRTEKYTTMEGGMSDAAKIMMIIGAALADFGSGMRGGSGTAGIQQFNRFVNMKLGEQKLELNKKRAARKDKVNYLGELRTKFNDEQAADQMYIASLSEIFNKEITEQIMKAEDEEKRFKLDILRKNIIASGIAARQRATQSLAQQIEKERGGQLPPGVVMTTGAKGLLAKPDKDLLKKVREERGGMRSFLTTATNLYNEIFAPGGDGRTLPRTRAGILAAQRAAQLILDSKNVFFPGEAMQEHEENLLKKASADITKLAVTDFDALGDAILRFIYSGANRWVSDLQQYNARDAVVEQYLGAPGTVFFGTYGTK